MKLFNFFVMYQKNSRQDLILIAFILCLGVWFLWDVSHWTGIVTIGTRQYGDAAFWWNGALHFGEGIIKNNPNLDFRMGYAIFAGLFVAIFGGDFFLFHKFLIVVFISSALYLYFSLVPSVGRIIAAGSIALLIFNPYTAEWLAISSSDSLGLIFNITAVASLINGLRNRLHLGFLAAFGAVIATASLTRPLMSPFVLASVFLLLVSSAIPRKRRIIGIGTVLTAFAIPTTLWVVFLHGITGSWAMAGHDSSAFYAASDPQVQVWNGEMYNKVEESAKMRHSTEKPTTSQMTEEFWLLTKKNYSLHFKHHISRAIPHVFSIASFSTKNASRKSWASQIVRGAILLTSMISLIIVSVVNGRRLGASLVLIVGLLAAFPQTQLILVMLSVVIFAYTVLLPNANRTYAVFALYWWTGVAALYLVGGTWGPPLGATHDLNALGYRLGVQFLFINDLLILFILGLCSTVKARSTLWDHNSLTSEQIHLEVDKSEGGVTPIPRPVTLLGKTLISVLLVLFIVGSSIVSYRVWRRGALEPLPFPATKSVRLWLQENQLRLNSPISEEVISDISQFNARIGTTSQGGTSSKYLVFTGEMSDFIWNLSGQNRSHAIVYIQENISPNSMSPGTIYLEFPKHLDESKWTRRQGIWIVRRIADLPSRSNLPYYYSETVIKAFVPLAKDKTNYDFSSAEIFPLQKYASQLYVASELKVIVGAIEWYHNSGVEKYPRRFSLQQTDSSNSKGTVILELDLSKMIGVRELSFRWTVEVQNSELIMQAKPALRIINNFGVQMDNLSNRVASTESGANYSKDFNYVYIDLTQKKYEKLKLVFDGMTPSSKLFINEFNVIADEFVH